jgi:hypothetical protein
MRDPRTHEEYAQRFAANTRVTGFGADTTMVMPCPFCAGPDFMQLRVMDFDHEVLRAGATCKLCGRSARGILERTPDMTSMRMVQTGGSDPAEYLPPMPRDTCPSGGGH